MGNGKKAKKIDLICDRRLEKYFSVTERALEEAKKNINKEKTKELLLRINQIANTYQKEMMPIKRKELAGLLKSAGLKSTSICFLFFGLSFF